MARWRVYIKPFDDDGEYQSDWTEVTSDVIELGSPKQGIDNTEFDVGVIKNSGFNITLRNDHGHYSEVNILTSIFRFTRKNTLIKITWDIRDYDLVCGFFQCGREPLGGEYLVFTGVINEVTSVSNIQYQQAVFSVLGFDSLLNEIDVPYSSINNGDTLSAMLYAMINQAPFTDHVSVSLSNITPGTDLAIDDKSSLENKTVGKVLKNILLAAQSVLFIKDGTVFVTDRTASEGTAFTFYGQASDRIENIISVPKYRDGMNRVFNHWIWTDVPAVVARDLTSITRYGTLEKEIKCELISDSSTSKIQTILNANRDEFSFPKRELDVETPIWYGTLALNILDRVVIDYPTVYIAADGGDIPRYDLAHIYDGTVRYPFEQWSLTIGTETDFKIVGKKIDVKKHTITFSLREN